MAHVITTACIDNMDRSCVSECPVDCIYEGGHMLYIHPGECIDCGACLPACPVDAIYVDEDLADVGQEEFEAINAEFFGSGVTGWNSPGSASKVGASVKDPPRVIALRNIGTNGGSGTAD